MKMAGRCNILLNLIDLQESIILNENCKVIFCDHLIWWPNLDEA